LNKIIKSVLEKLENNGFEAYIIGGYVRDLLVGISSYDIDICTNATPRELINIFPNSSTKNLGGIDFKRKEYHFEITTYRKELKYKNRKPLELNYINSLVEDIQRRDFTINTICMNKKGDIIDLLNGVADIKNHQLRMVGNPKIKIKEDPYRILRGVRMASTLNLTIESNLYKALLENNKEILTLSGTRIKEELDKILLSNNVKKGLKLLEDLELTKILKMSYDEEITPVKNLEGMYAQIRIEHALPFTKVEKNNIKVLKMILKEKEITPKTIYQYGLYSCTIAAEIKKINKKKINKMYKELPIHDKSEINLKAEELIKTLNINGKEISKVLKKLEEAILEGKVKNKKNEIMKYINKIYNDTTE